MENKYIEEYYNEYDEEGRLLSGYGQVEYLTTCRYIDRYLRQGMNILEVGAGTGRYSVQYARQGYPVDALELVPHNIDRMKEKIETSMDIRVRQGNALDLSCYESDSFDLTLVLGPMYHLYTLEEKKKVVEESLRVTRPGGIIFYAFIMNDAVITDWGLKNGNLAKGIKEGIVTKDFHCVGIPQLLFDMTTVQEIEELMKGFQVEKLHLVASDGMANYFRDTITEADEELFQAWLEYHYATCERPDLIGHSHHSLYIGRKRERHEYKCENKFSHP